MQILPPLCTTSRLLPGCQIADGSHISIDYCGHPDKEGRQHFRWSVDLFAPLEVDPLDDSLLDLVDKEENSISICYPRYATFQGTLSIPSGGTLQKGLEGLLRLLETIAVIYEPEEEDDCDDACIECHEKEEGEAAEAPEPKGCGADKCACGDDTSLELGQWVKEIPPELAFWAMENLDELTALVKAMQDQPGELIVE